MFTLHLSRFLKGPPGPAIQQVNALLQTEPYSSIFYHLFWTLVLLFGAPLIGVCLPFLLCWELLRQVWSNKDQRIDPKEVLVRDNTKLAVVVTGCDSGIGKELVWRLAAEGFVVFAGCIQTNSLDHFVTEPMIHAMIVDVTSDDQVQACSTVVQTWLEDTTAKSDGEKRVLHSLVNNAGACIAGYLDWINVPDYEFCMNVNCFGQIRMVKAFLPILKQQAISECYKNAQIINMVSIAGIVSAGGFASSAYETSKYAAEAFTNGLRLEMKMFGIRVVALNPSFIDTPLTSGVKERLKRDLWDKFSDETKEEYGEEFFENYANHCDNMTTAGKWKVHVVVDSIMGALQSKFPPTQLLIGMDKFGHMVFQMFPQWARHFMVQIALPPQTPKILNSE